jgi:hypothetical protein
MKEEKEKGVLPTSAVTNIGTVRSTASDVITRDMETATLQGRRGTSCKSKSKTMGLQFFFVQGSIFFYGDQRYRSP